MSDDNSLNAARDALKKARAKSGETICGWKDRERNKAAGAVEQDRNPV